MSDSSNPILHPRFFVRVVPRAFVETVAALELTEFGLNKRIHQSGLKDPRAYLDYLDEHAKRQLETTVYYALYQGHAARDVSMSTIEDVLDCEPVGYARGVVGRDLPGSVGLPHEPLVFTLTNLYVVRQLRGRGGMLTFGHALTEHSQSVGCKYVVCRVEKNSLRRAMGGMGFITTPLMFARLDRVRLKPAPTDYDEGYKAPLARTGKWKR